jgi:hypothetical protein
MVFISLTVYILRARPSVVLVKGAVPPIQGAKQQTSATGSECSATASRCVDAGTLLVSKAVGSAVPSRVRTKRSPLPFARRTSRVTARSQVRMPPFFVRVIAAPSAGVRDRDGWRGAALPFTGRSVAGCRRGSCACAPPRKRSRQLPKRNSSSRCANGSLRRWREAGAPAHMRCMARDARRLSTTSGGSTLGANSSSRHGARAPPVQVELEKPLGMKFARGADGGAYIIKNEPTLGNTDPRIQVGGRWCGCGCGCGWQVVWVWVCCAGAQAGASAAQGRMVVLLATSCPPPAASRDTSDEYTPS